MYSGNFILKTVSWCSFGVLTFRIPVNLELSIHLCSMLSVCIFQLSIKKELQYRVLFHSVPCILPAYYFTFYNISFVFSASARYQVTVLYDSFHENLKLFFKVKYNALRKFRYDCYFRMFIF